MNYYLADREAIRSNLAVIQQKAEQTPIWAVLKGDGYGLGVENMADICREAGVDRFAVTEVREAAAIRRTGARPEKILMLRPTCDRAELTELLSLGVICTVASQQDAVALAGIARELGVHGAAHLKIDTGMGRYGFLPQETEHILACFAYLDSMEIQGIYTHFACAFCSKKKTRRQAEMLQTVVDAITAAGFDPGEVHLCNSNGLFRYPQYRRDGVRIGSALLGRLGGLRTGLQKVGVCHTEAREVRWLEKGQTVGYGSGWVAKKPTRIAVLPVGWYHGYTVSYGDDLFRRRDSLRKILSGVRNFLFPPKLTVTVDGTACPVLGHVGMLHTVLDVTQTSLREGDPVCLEINPLFVRGMEIRFDAAQ